MLRKNRRTLRNAVFIAAAAANVQINRISEAGAVLRHVPASSTRTASQPRTTIPKSKNVRELAKFFEDANKQRGHLLDGEKPTRLVVELHKDEVDKDQRRPMRNVVSTTVTERKNNFLNRRPAMVRSGSVGLGGDVEYAKRRLREKAESQLSVDSGLGSNTALSRIGSVASLRSGYEQQIRNGSSMANIASTNHRSSGVPVRDGISTPNLFRHSDSISYSDHYEWDEEYGSDAEENLESSDIELEEGKKLYPHPLPSYEEALRKRPEEDEPYQLNPEKVLFRGTDYQLTYDNLRNAASLDSVKIEDERVSDENRTKSLGALHNIAFGKSRTKSSNTSEANSLAKTRLPQKRHSLGFQSKRRSDLIRLKRSNSVGSGTYIDGPIQRKVATSPGRRSLSVSTVNLDVSAGGGLSSVDTTASMDNMNETVQNMTDVGKPAMDAVEETNNSCGMGSEEGGNLVDDNTVRNNSLKTSARGSRTSSRTSSTRSSISSVVNDMKPATTPILSDTSNRAGDLADASISMSEMSFTEASAKNSSANREMADSDSSSAIGGTDGALNAVCGTDGALNSVGGTDGALSGISDSNADNLIDDSCASNSGAKDIITDSTSKDGSADSSVNNSICGGDPCTTTIGDSGANHTMSESDTIADTLGDSATGSGIGDDSVSNHKGRKNGVVINKETSEVVHKRTELSSRPRTSIKRGSKKTSGEALKTRREATPFNRQSTPPKRQLRKTLNPQSTRASNRQLTTPLDAVPRTPYQCPSPKYEIKYQARLTTKSSHELINGLIRNYLNSRIMISTAFPAKVIKLATGIMDKLGNASPNPKSFFEAISPIILNINRQNKTKAVDQINRKHFDAIMKVESPMHKWVLACTVVPIWHICSSDSFNGAASYMTQLRPLLTVTSGALQETISKMLVALTDIQKKHKRQKQKTQEDLRRDYRIKVTNSYLDEIVENFTLNCQCDSCDKCSCKNCNMCNSCGDCISSKEQAP